MDIISNRIINIYFDNSNTIIDMDIDIHHQHTMQYHMVLYSKENNMKEELNVFGKSIRLVGEGVQVISDTCSIRTIKCVSNKLLDTKNYIVHNFEEGRQNRKDQLNE